MPFIPIIIAYLKRNAIPVIGAGLIVLIVVLVFNRWTESLIESGRREVRQQWTERGADMARKTDELIKRKAREAEVINQLNHEKANHAIQLYTKHYNNLRRAADAAPKRLYIHTKTASCSGNTVPGSGGDQSGFGQGSAGITKTELPADNLRQLNEVIEKVERLQLQCEQLLNTVAE